MLQQPGHDQPRAHSRRPRSGITQAVYPVPSELKSALLVELLRRGEIRSVIVFTRTKHRANRAGRLPRRGRASPPAAIHGNRSQSQRTQALEAFKDGKFPVLVATDIAARGIDVEALSHVINFDVPASPDDYVHRVGRTAPRRGEGRRVPLRGAGRGRQPARDRAGHRASGCPRVTLPGFDYTKRTAEKLEVPLQQRLAEHRRRQRHAPRGRPAVTPARPAGGGRSGPAAARPGARLLPLVR